MKAETEDIPVFPLNLVLFPGEELNLHIFEPRYRELISDSVESNSVFGIPTVSNGRLLKVGTSASVKQVVKKYADGRMDIVVEGIRRFDIQTVYSPMAGHLYDGASVHWLDNETTSDTDKQQKMMQLIRKVYQSLQVKKLGLTDRSDLSTFEVGHYIGLSLEQEYELLCIESENKRQDYIIDFLETIIPTMSTVDRLRERVAMNGHFRELGSGDFKF